MLIPYRALIRVIVISLAARTPALAADIARGHPPDPPLKDGHENVIALLKAEGVKAAQDAPGPPDEAILKKDDEEGLTTPLKFTILYDNYVRMGTGRRLELGMKHGKRGSTPTATTASWVCRPAIDDPVRVQARSARGHAHGQVASKQ